MSLIGAANSAQQRPLLVVPTWAVGVPAVLLIGFLALLGRAGVGIQLFGLPLGAYLTPLPSLLVLCLAVTSRGRDLLHSLDRSQRRIALAVLVAVAVGLLRAAAQGMPTLLRFQDMAYLLHLPWIVVGMAAMRALASDEERTRLLRWLAWAFVVVLTVHWARDAKAPVALLFEQLVSALQGGSDKPDLLLKDSDRALFGIALSALALHLTGDRRRTGVGLVSISGLLLGTQLADLVFGGSRGALLGMLLGVAILITQGTPRAARTAFLAGTALSFALSSTAHLGAAPNPTSAVPAATGVEAPKSVESPNESLSIGQRYTLLSNRRAATETFQQLRIKDGQFVEPSTVSWRIDIWRDVIYEWNSSGKNQVFGIGFGNEIEAMTVPGRQGFDGLNRSVHSIAFTVLARQGLLGVVTGSAVLLSFLLRPTLERRVALAVLGTGIVVGLFDTFFEGVQAPVVLFLILGMSSHSIVASTFSSRTHYHAIVPNYKAAENP